MTATQTIRPEGIPPGGGVGVPTIVQTASAAVATIANADAALQQRMTREGYVLGYVGVGAAAGQTVGRTPGFVIGGVAAGAFAFYRSRQPRA